MTTEPYRPSNGTEGDIFQERWCRRCDRDRNPALPCHILTRTMAYGVGDKEYPKQWLRTPDTGWPGDAHCTAFREISLKRRVKSNIVRDKRQEALGL